VIDREALESILHDELAKMRLTDEERKRTVEELNVPACLLIGIVEKQSLPNAKERGPAPGS
jgi:hypothetical protein